MKPAPILPNEEQRLADLFSYNIVDTDPELCFDNLTDLISQICDTPIALISLIDEKRQWFKSRQGLAATETPREISFCGHAIHESDIFEIPDSTQDRRFSDNPLVTGEPRVIFYAGYPLTLENGSSLGTLCVIDHKPRSLTDFQKHSLKILGQQVIAQMELRKQNISLRKAYKDIENQQIQAINTSKMASLGQMAGGISHEINNPLAIIKMFVQEIELLSESQPEQKALTENCQKIHNTISRISKIIKGLRSLSRDVATDPMALESLSEVIDDALQLCAGKLKSNNVQYSIEGDLCREIFCRSGEISQVILNLISNAFDAIEELESKWIKVLINNESRFTRISIINSGPRIPAEQAQAIMDPFYTTKPVGKGTGLGLSISKSIIENHQGQLYLDLESEHTKFDILLPQKNHSSQQEAI